MLAGCAGLCFVFLVPLMEVPDEVEHFYRAYQVSTFDVTSDKLATGGYGGQLPTSVMQVSTQLKGNVAGNPAMKFQIATLKKLAQIPLNRTAVSSVRFDNTGIYSPTNYSPQTAGILLARLFHAKVVTIAYAARLANFIVWLALVYLAIRLTPIGKWAFAVFGLNPVALSLASSISADAFCIGVSFVLIALVLRLRVRDLPVPRWALAGLTGLILLEALMKPAYLPLIFLVLLVPRLGKTAKIGLITAGLITSVVWNVHVARIGGQIPAQFGMPATVNAIHQEHFVATHPLTYVKVFVDNLVGPASNAVASSYAGLVGWADTGLNTWIQILEYLMIALSLLYITDEKFSSRAFGAVSKLTFALIFLASFSLIYLMLYVGFSPLGAAVISGVQGRYLIPLSPLLIPIVFQRQFRIAASPAVFGRVITSGAALALAASLITIGYRYY